MITIIDYGMGNLRSIQKTLARLEIESRISGTAEDIESADKLILPGVGHFANAMQNLDESGLRPVIERKVLKDETPILGICLGMQLFCKHSEEGDVDGLGWLNADTVRFQVRDKREFKVPHIGWNTLDFSGDAFLFQHMVADDQVYFVHSYHVVAYDQTDILSKTTYDYEFVSAVHRGNIWGTQFHPEKSHKVGMEILRRFSCCCN